jgi:mRNA-degrading endonuclease toxin of MazEF toxin-antitoxin module
LPGPAAPRRIRQGDIYWLDDCPPLYGEVAKRRPVIIISPSAVALAAEQIVIVACTSTILPSDVEAIELPNRARTPQTHSGLTRRTRAVPRWWLPVPRERLTDYAGYISGNLLRRVVTAATVHMGRP